MIRSLQNVARQGLTHQRLTSLSCHARFLLSSSTTPLQSQSTSTTTSTIIQPPLANKISVIGAGMMATAMVEPMVSTGVQPADRFCVFDVSEHALQNMHAQFNVPTAQSIPDCLQGADLVLLAVKPQNLTPGFFDQVRAAQVADQGAIAVSVIAGTPLRVLQEGMCGDNDTTDTGGGKIRKVVRSMPNTPATIGQGMTVWSCTPNLTTDDRTLVRQVLNSFGKTMYVDDEAFIDMSTSISGSGPAYIFMLMEAMIDAGVHMGFPRDQATTLVYHTMLGSTLYAMETKEHPAILRNRVTSPSGTTASAIYELENGKFRTVIKDAMWACYRRSLEMGNHDSNVGPDRRRGGSSGAPP